MFEYQSFPSSKYNHRFSGPRPHRLGTSGEFQTIFEYHCMILLCITVLKKIYHLFEIDNIKKLHIKNNIMY